MRDGCNHTSKPTRALSVAKPTSREASIDIKHKSKLETIAYREMIQTLKYGPRSMDVDLDH